MTIAVSTVAYGAFGAMHVERDRPGTFGDRRAGVNRYLGAACRRAGLVAGCRRG